MNAPCMGCERRELGCHGICQDYISWSKKKADRRNEIFIGKVPYLALYNFRRDVRFKVKHGRAMY